MARQSVAAFCIWWALAVPVAAYLQPVRSGLPATNKAILRDSSYGIRGRQHARANNIEMKAERKKVLVLGGDGFCGWPTALYLSDRGHDVIIVDNLSRRDIDNELGCSSLTPIESPEVRVRTWNALTGNEMRFVNLDVAKDYDLFVQVR